jgi:hypothetical protein
MLIKFIWHISCIILQTEWTEKISNPRWSFIWHEWLKDFNCFSRVLLKQTGSISDSNKWYYMCYKNMKICWDAQIADITVLYQSWNLFVLINITACLMQWYSILLSTAFTECLKFTKQDTKNCWDNIYKEPTWCNLAVCLLITAITLYMFRTLIASIFRST